MTRISPAGVEWERVHPGFYECADRSIVRVSASRWELAGLTVETSRHPSLRAAMAAADES